MNELYLGNIYENHNFMKSNLQNFYKLLSKKQKGVVIQEIISHQDFNKSKEWLRKYLAGAYERVEHKVEEIGLLALKKVNIEPAIQFLVPTVVSENIIKLDEEVGLDLVMETLPKVSVNMFKSIYEEYNNCQSSTKVGKGWLRFGRICRKKLDKVNPFQKITELVINDEKIVKNKSIEELEILYNQNLYSEKDYLYITAWELFSQKSRFVYYVNPFRAIQSIIQNNLN